MDPEEDYSPGDYLRPYERMQNVYDKLLLLNFEQEFLKMTRVRAFHRLYFMCPTNPGEQFFNFVSLSTWLLRKCGKEIEMAQESDDPNVLIANILEQSRSMGGVMDFNPSRVKSGFGPDVVEVLDFLTDNALVSSEHQWLPPVVLKEQKEDDEIGEVDQEVILEKIEDEIEAYYSSEGEDTDLVWVQGSSAGSGQGPETSQPDSGKILQSDIVDTEQWRLEVERVLPQLKITIQQDSQDWRQRQEQMRTYTEAVSDVVEQLDGPLDKMITDARSVIEKVKTRENFINTEFETLLMELSVTQDNVATMKDRHRELSNKATTKNRTLSQLNDELDTIRRQLNDRGSIMADGAPVSATKKSIAALKKELGDMEVEIAVVEHCLMKSLLQEQIAQREKPA
ncbi:unnamed protein product [Allacma fusca]|uniref:Intraflagellar transport protein 57 homolog n=1 Tax=Allacma fusca TaxID=39272 RepID=A0A8J2KNW6_9HEXA|nr:unnamed protein product [Allacma fusca]